MCVRAVTHSEEGESVVGDVCGEGLCVRVCVCTSHIRHTPTSHTSHIHHTITHTTHHTHNITHIHTPISNTHTHTPPYTHTHQVGLPVVIKAFEETSTKIKQSFLNIMNMIVTSRVPRLKVLIHAQRDVFFKQLCVMCV